jgi:hypothetical protein
MKIQRLHFTQYLQRLLMKTQSATHLWRMTNTQCGLRRSAPFEHGAPFVRVARAHERVHYARQRHEKSNQKIAELAALQMLIKSTADENRKSNDPHGAVPGQQGRQ